jgi:uncharacterized membrane protein YphA (DoxX/SURF4 family)
LLIENTTKGATMNVNRIPLIGLLIIQAAIGYEWAMSGATKLVRGDFPSGLAAELRDKSQGAASWYRSFLDGAVIPHASSWGYAIEIGELLIGVVLIATALLWLFGWERVHGQRRQLVLVAVAAAALAGVVMNVNFHLANGSPHPWLIPKSGFDEGVDLDSLMPFIQIVLAGVSLKLWANLRRERHPSKAAPAAGVVAKA